MRRALIAILAIVVMTTIATAQETRPANLIHRSSSPTTAPASTTPGTFDTSRVVLSLAAVLALILVLRWAARKLPAVSGRSARAIQVLSRSYISNKQQIMIVQVGRRLLVVGDGGQQLNTLCEITDPDEMAALLGQIRGEGNESSAAATIAGIFRRENEKPATAASPEFAPARADDQLTGAREQLNGLAEKVRVVARHLKEA